MKVMLTDKSNLGWLAHRSTKRLRRHDHATLGLGVPQAPTCRHCRGRRAKEEINRQAMAVRDRGLQQVRGAVRKGRISVGRDDIDAVGFAGHPVLDREDLHGGATLAGFGEDALVVGRGGCWCSTRTQALPGALSVGMLEKNFSKAARPPAEAPMPTRGKFSSGGGVLPSGRLWLLLPFPISMYPNYLYGGRFFLFGHLDYSG